MSPLDRLEWLSAVLSARLTGGQLKVAVAMALRTNSQTGACHPSKACLCDDTGLSEYVVRLAVATLSEAGLLEVSFSNGRNSNRYTLTQPKANPVMGNGVASNGDAHNPVMGNAPTPLLATRNPVMGNYRNKGKNKVREQGKYAPASRARATPSRLPSDWEPNQAARDWIASFGLTPQEAAPVLSEFRQYWAERTTKRADWSLAFRRNARAEAGLIRLRNAKQGTGTHPPGGTGPEPTGAAHYKPFSFE